MTGGAGRFWVIGGIGVVLALAGCAGSGDPQPQGATSLTAELRAPTTEVQPDKATSLSPTPVDRQVHEYTGFISPTGNVACAIDTDYARCDIIDRDWEPPPRPADCEFDYGQGITLSPGDPAEFICAGDTAFGPDEVLAYGHSITGGVLTCESAESGITCRDAVSGRGFSISRQSYTLF